MSSAADLPGPPELSETLREFVALAPVARQPHIDFLWAASASMPAGSTVLDVGSGDAPYRELFAQHRYLTSDWEGTQYSPDEQPDIIGPAHDLPVGTSSLDAVVCTQVIEHVPEPWLVLDEFARVVRPGGQVFITAPLTWYLHELPHDYYRYTGQGLAHLLGRSGFVDVEVRPMNTSASTLAQLLEHVGYLLGSSPDGHDPRRVQAGDVARRLASVVGSFSDLDTQWWLPVSFSARGRLPEA